MQRECDACGKPYQAKRANSRFCSDTCRKRGQRGIDLRAVPRVVPLGNGLEQAVRAELTAAERIETSAGQAALALAIRVDAGGDTGSAVASLVREMRATLSEALKGVPAQPDALDELRHRRDAKLRGA